MCDLVVEPQRVKAWSAITAAHVRALYEELARLKASDNLLPPKARALVQAMQESEAAAPGSPRFDELPAKKRSMRSPADSPVRLAAATVGGFAAPRFLLGPAAADGECSGSSVALAQARQRALLAESVDRLPSHDSEVDLRIGVDLLDDLFAGSTSASTSAPASGRASAVSSSSSSAPPPADAVAAAPAAVGMSSKEANYGPHDQIRFCEQVAFHPGATLWIEAGGPTQPPTAPPRPGGGAAGGRGGGGAAAGGDGRGGRGHCRGGLRRAASESEVLSTGGLWELPQREARRLIEDALAPRASPTLGRRLASPPPPAPRTAAGDITPMRYNDYSDEIAKASRGGCPTPTGAETAATPCLASTTGRWPSQDGVPPSSERGMGHCRLLLDSC